MELKECKKVLETNLEVITNLWRSLWHIIKKRSYKQSPKENGRYKFLEWS